MEGKISSKEISLEPYPGGGNWPSAYFQTIMADLLGCLKTEAIAFGCQPEQDITTIAYNVFRGLRRTMDIESTLILPEP